MKTGQELFQEHVNRLAAAIALQKPDRVPVIINSDAFNAVHLGIKLSELVKDFDRFCDVILQATKELGDADGLVSTSMDPDVLGLSWLSNIKIPGRELGDNMLWQVDEQEILTDEDYDMILNKGWNEFFGYYVTNKLDNLMAKIGPFLEYTPKDIIKAVDAGYVPFGSTKVVPAFDMLSGGRGMAKFIQDLYRKPDKMQEVMDVVNAATIGMTVNMVKDAKPFAVFLGGARCSSQFLNRKLFDRFSWPYIRDIANAVIDAGSFAYLHLDGDWERDLGVFRELPEKQCIFGTDGTSDIYKFKEVLGDRFCIFGDVPPALLTLGTADETYKYCTRLINEIGPSGFILAAGCTIPQNAKFENVKAMVSAANGK